MANEPSLGVSETQQPPSTPVTGTPTSPGETPTPKPTLTLEEVLKRNAELEHSHRNAREQADRQAKLLEKYQKQEKDAEAAQKAAEDAKLGEIERITKQHKELQDKYEAALAKQQEMVARNNVTATATKLNFAHPDLAYRLVNQSEFERDDEGNVTNAEALLNKLLADYPDLAKKQETPPAQPTKPTTPAIPTMNPGRSNIQPAGTNPPNRIPRLSDPGLFVSPGTPSKYQP